LNQHVVHMSYPNRLLPQQDYKKICWFEDLRKYFLVHTTETKENIDPQTGKLKISLVVRQTDHLKDYSNNLLGVFLIDDVYWIPNSNSANRLYYREAWVEGDCVIPPVVPSDFDINVNKGYFFLKISDFHEVVINFEDNTFASPICRLLHTPTNSNFWHFSLRWYFDGKDLESWTEGIKRRMKTSAKAFIIEKAFFEEPFFEELDTNHYKK
jgi:hypothetical protein